MLDIEGTRNERAVVIVASYIIGFVSAYIWFAASVSLAPSQLTLTNEADKPEAFTSAAPSMQASASSVTYEEGILEYHTDGNSEILSVASSRVPQDSQEYLQENGGQGVHEDISNYLLSRDGRFVFFCENYGGPTCAGFVYDVDGDIIRPIRAADGENLIDERQAQLASYSADGLVIGDQHSVAPDTPWLLTR